MKAIKSIEKYAYLLLNLAKDEKQLSTYKNDLTKVLYVVEEHNNFIKRLSNNTETQSERKSVIDQIFKGEINNYVLSFLHLLIEREAMNLLGSIARKSLALINKELGLKQVVITTAYELKPTQAERLVNALKQKYASDIEPTFVVDSTIIGGISISNYSEIFDASLKTKLFSIMKKNYYEQD